MKYTQSTLDKLLESQKLYEEVVKKSVTVTE